MFKRLFNRIFWKMFAVIWLANSAIILAMGYVLLHHQASGRLAAIHQQQVQSLAQIIIQRHEAGRPMPRANWDRWPKLQERFQLPPRFYMEIESEDGEWSFKLPGSRKRPKNAQELTLPTDSGREYRVFFADKPLPPFIVRPFRDLVSLQSVLMLLAAAFISGVLSWQLVRPLKMLARVGQQYRVGVASSDGLGDTRLLKRGDELGDLARALEAMIKRTEAVFSAQKNLLHDVSHELRAPLARLQVAASLVEREIPASVHVSKIHVQCGRINNLIQQILDFARIEEGVIQPVAMDLNALVAEVVGDVRFEFPARKIHLAPFEGEAIAKGEPELLLRALENVLRNACKHTPSASPIDIEIKRRSSLDADKQWRIVVRDHGQGVQEAEREKLLQPFYRSGEQMHTEGFGLGLSIAVRAIAKQGGSLILKNHPEGGLQVEIDLQ